MFTAFVGAFQDDLLGDFASVNEAKTVARNCGYRFVSIVKFGGTDFKVYDLHELENQED